jgi:hypothetical protein
MGAASVAADNNTAGAGAGSPSAGAGSQSVDDILDSAFTGDEGTGDDPAAGVDAADAEGVEESTADEQDQEGEGEGQDEQAQDQTDQQQQQAQTPAKYKDVFKAHPELRNAFFASQAYREVFPNIAEARQMRELYPTVADAQQAREHADELAELDDLFFSSDPKDHQTFLSGLHQEDPAAFLSMAQQMPQFLYQVAPEAYRADTAARFTSTFRNLQRNAEQMGVGEGQPGQNLRNAIAVISRHLKLDLDTQGGQLQDPMALENQRRSQDLNRQREEFETQRTQEFYDKTNQQVVDDVTASIKTEVQNLVAATKTKVSEKALNKLIGEAYTEIDATLRANRSLRSELRRALQSRSQQKVQDLLKKHYAPLLKPTVAKKFREWTQEVLQLNKTQLDNSRRQGQRVDVTGGAGTPGRSGKGGAVSVKDIDYRRTSDDDILNDRVTVRKR